MGTPDTRDDTPQEDSALLSYLEAAAAFRGLPHPERIPKWADRLRMNAPELDRFRSAPAPAEEPWSAPASATPELETGEPETPAPMEGLADVARRIRMGEIDAVARVEEQLARIRAKASLNAFTTVDEAAVRKEAEALARRLRAGSATGRLAGVTLAVKDLIAVEGWPLTGGTRAVDPVRPAEDAPVVARLRAEGALIIGMANLHELAYGITSRNPHFGTVGNPRHPERIAGGSSGGSAAAVAAGLADAALGSDTAGSIRIPAACCGIVGFKPSYDAVTREGVMALAWSLDHVGPLTATVLDAALLFEVMAGLPDGAVHGRVAPVANRRFRLVRPTSYFTDPMDPAVAAAFGAACGHLLDAGWTIDDRSIPGIDLAPAIQFHTICPEATEGHQNRALARPEGLGEDVRVRLEIGRFLPATDYVKAQRLRRRLALDMMEAFRDADAMITPTLLAGAPAVEAAEVDVNGTVLPVHTALTRCTAPFNLTGMPAITLPCGCDRDGLPIGIQIVGRPGADVTVLRVAAAVEAILRPETG